MSEDAVFRWRPKGEPVLGEFDDGAGDRGAGLLEAVVQDIGEVPERRYSAILAVAKHRGSGSTALLRRCLRDSDRTMQDHALMALAVVGDDSAWEDVFPQLEAEIGSRDVRFPVGLQFETLVLQSAVLPMACYLGRHLGQPGRRDRVVGLIRQGWSRLYSAEQQWFGIFWPACHPEEGDTIPADPNPDDLSRCVADVFFADV